MWVRIRFIVISAIFVILAGMTAVGQAQSPLGPVDFGTGYPVQGEFLERYSSVPNPIDIYGLPITGEFESLSVNGFTTVQYFTKARFDVVNDGFEDQIVVADLGELTYPGPGPLAPVPSDGPSCRRFDNGKSVCYAFLQFYDANNGTVNFGEPISDLEIREGHYVQYFEKVRMEWQPERAGQTHVVLTDLGKRYFDMTVGEVPNQPLTAVIGQLRNPRVLAFVGKSLAPAHSQQQIFVVVLDKFNRPIAGAQVWVYEKSSGGTLNPFRAPDTNQNGISILPYTVGNLQPRQVVEFLVKINAGGETAEGQTWFRVWY